MVLKKKKNFGLQFSGAGLASILCKVSSVQLLSHVQLFATPWIVAHQACLSITNSQSLLRLMSVELVMPSNHLILIFDLFLYLAVPGLCFGMQDP